MKNNNKRREEKYEKILTYLATSGDFLGGGTIELEVEKHRYQRMGAVVPIYSVTKPKHDADVPFGYSCDPMADSIEALLGRIIIW